MRQLTESRIDVWFNQNFTAFSCNRSWASTLNVIDHICFNSHKRPLQNMHFVLKQRELETCLSLNGRLSFVLKQRKLETYFSLNGRLFICCRMSWQWLHTSWQGNTFGNVLVSLQCDNFLLMLAILFGQSNTFLFLL